MSIAIGVSLIISPFFATIDLENRFHYCFRSFQRMYFLIIQAFLSEDPIAAKIYLSRASIIEERIRQTLSIVPNRLIDTRYEPSRFLQRIFFGRRKSMSNLSVQAKANLLSSLMFHASSLQLMIRQCSFNRYHHDLRITLESSLIFLNSCQSSLIAAMTSSQHVTEEKCNYILTNLQTAIDFVRISYKKAHRNQSEIDNQSDDYLAHAFFLFQIFTIVNLFIDSTVIKPQINPTRRSIMMIIKSFFQFHRARLLLSIKSMIVIGVGSIFVMVPSLAKIFENGQWILIALCMTQADTVGGALNAMRMRLVGTLLGETQKKKQL